MFRQTVLSSVMGLCLIGISGPGFSQQPDDEEQPVNTKPNPEELGERRAMPADLETKALKIDPSGPVAAEGTAKMRPVTQGKPAAVATETASGEVQRKALKIEPAVKQETSKPGSLGDENPTDAIPSELELPTGQDKD